MKNLHGETPLKSRIQAKLRKVCFYVLQNVNKKFFYCNLKTSFRPSKTLGFLRSIKHNFHQRNFYPFVYEYFIRIYMNILYVYL